MAAAAKAVTLRSAAWYRLMRVTRLALSVRQTTAMRNLISLHASLADPSVHQATQRELESGTERADENSPREGKRKKREKKKSN